MIKCCKDCSERTIDCHSWCKRYKDTKAKHDQDKEKIIVVKKADYDYLEFHKRVISAIKNRTRKK